MTDGILAKRRVKRGLRGRGKTGRERGWAIFCGAWLTTVVAGVLGPRLSDLPLKSGRWKNTLANDKWTCKWSGVRDKAYDL